MKIFPSQTTHFSSIWPIDRTLSCATTPSQRECRSDGNKGVLRIPQSSSITGSSPSDCLVLYPGRSLGGGSYPSAENQSVYSTAPVHWAIKSIRKKKKRNLKHPMRIELTNNDLQAKLTRYHARHQEGKEKVDWVSKKEKKKERIDKVQGRFKSRV